MTSSKTLWIGAAVLILGGTVAKQLIWHKVSNEVHNIREEEHKQAQADLHAAYSRAQQFSLPPLSDEEREKLKNIHGKTDLSKHP